MLPLYLHIYQKSDENDDDDDDDDDNMRFWPFMKAFCITKVVCKTGLIVLKFSGMQCPACL